MKKADTKSKPQLTAKEKKLLERKLRPIKDAVKYLYRYQYSDRDCGFETFDVILKNGWEIEAPIDGDANKAFMGVEEDRNYTLEELGLFQDQE